jgi:hypothetical protein
LSFRSGDPDPVAIQLPAAWASAPHSQAKFSLATRLTLWDQYHRSANEKPRLENAPMLSPLSRYEVIIISGCDRLQVLVEAFLSR